MDELVRKALGRIIADIAPSELLQIGEFELANFSSKITTMAYGIPDFSKRYPLAIVRLQGHAIDMAILARLRDLVADCVIAIIPNNTTIDYRALGFKCLAKSAEFQLCSFDIANYKHTPDWLNSKYWANPELWNQHRW